MAQPGGDPGIDARCKMKAVPLNEIAPKRLPGNSLSLERLCHNVIPRR